MNGKNYEMPVFSGRTMRKIESYIMIVAFVCLFLALTEIRKGMGVLFVPGFVVFLFLRWQEKNIMKRCVWNFGAEGACRRIWGFESCVSYGEINEALQSRKIKVTATAFQIPKMKGYITFHYEVGNDKAQIATMESYKFLLKHISVKTPPLSLRVIQQMDRSFYYKRIRRNCALFMPVFAIPMIFVGSESVLIGFLRVGLGQIAQYAMLLFLFRGIYFGKKAEKKIEDMFAPYGNVELRRVNVSYARMAVSVVLSAAANLCFLFAGWRWILK